MYLYFFYILLLSLCNKIIFSDNIDENKVYQDVLINNKIVETGNRTCQDRYDVIKPILDKYKRPFTVLDIGAAQGYFSFRIAHEYKSVCVMLEGGYPYSHMNPNEDPDRLFQLCKANSHLNNIIFIRKHITIEDLKKLSECEHFDVVLALNVIHHFKNWNEVAQTIFSLGDNIIIENPNYSDANLEKMLIAVKHKQLGTFPRNQNHLGTIRWYELKKKTLSTNIFSKSKMSDAIQYQIRVDYFDKKFYKVDKNNNIIKNSIYLPGINLCTFKFLNGVWPSFDIINKSIIDLNNKNKIKDPFNIIIQGHEIKELDKMTTDFCNIEKLLKFVEMKNFSKVHDALDKLK